MPVRTVDAMPSAVRRAARVLALALSTTLWLSCAGGGDVTGPPEPLPVASIQVTPGADTLIAVGRTRTFTAIARAADGTAIAGTTIRWRSSDTLVARVDSTTGVVTALRDGLATISAHAGTVSGSGTVAVIQFVATVAVSPSTANLTVIGGTQLFTAQARDSANAAVPGVRFLWTSSNTAVATIDSTGTATVVGPGETIISASGRGVPAFARVSVTQLAAHLAFTIEPATVRAGDAFATAMQVEVRDANGALVRDARVPITLGLAVDPVGDATLAGTATVQTVGGVATFAGNWIDRASPGFRLRVAAPGLVPDTSVAFEVRPGAPATLSAPELGTAEVGASRSLEMSVADRFGNLIDTTYTFYLTPSTAVGGIGGGVRHGLTTRLAPGLFQIEDVAFTRAGTMQLAAEAYIDGDRVPVTSSSRVTATATFEEMAIGDYTACGLSAVGALCWGDNASRQFGFGFPTAGDSVPTLIGAAYGTEPLASIQPARNGTCALGVSGRAYCWGSVSRWPAGPIDGTGPGGQVFTALTVGGDHACGLTADGAAWCWGDGGQGELGDGSLTARTLTPVRVRGSGTGDTVFTRLAAGDLHTCGITAAGRAFCWGYNGYGMVGDSTLTRRTVPTLVAGSGAGARVFTSIVASTFRSCGTTTAGPVLCWGEDQRLAAAGNNLVPAAAFDGTGWSSVSAGTYHTCAIQSGAVHCLGTNEYGSVGPNAAFFQTFALAVPLNGRTATRVWAGGTSSCAQTADGVYCWGRNRAGMLGIGSTAVEIVRDPARMIH